MEVMPHGGVSSIGFAHRARMGLRHQRMEWKVSGNVDFKKRSGVEHLINEDNVCFDCGDLSPMLLMAALIERDCDRSE